MHLRKTHTGLMEAMIVPFKCCRHCTGKMCEGNRMCVSVYREGRGRKMGGAWVGRGRGNVPHGCVTIH